MLVSLKNRIRRGWTALGSWGTCCCGGPPPCETYTVCVIGCTCGLPGATVTLFDSGGTEIVSGTTGEDGCITFTDVMTTATTCSISADNFVTQTGLGVVCDGTVTYTLSPDDGAICCHCDDASCCAAVPPTLMLTDNLGGCTLGPGLFHQWEGCYNGSAGAALSPCQCGMDEQVPAGSQVSVYYFLDCGCYTVDGVHYDYQLSRSWKYCGNTGSFEDPANAYCSDGDFSDGCQDVSTFCPDEGVSAACEDGQGDLGYFNASSCDPFTATVTLPAFDPTNGPPSPFSGDTMISA